MDKNGTLHAIRLLRGSSYGYPINGTSWRCRRTSFYMQQYLWPKPGITMDLRYMSSQDSHFAAQRSQGAAQSEDWKLPATWKLAACEIAAIFGAMLVVWIYLSTKHPNCIWCDSICHPSSTLIQYDDILCDPDLDPKVVPLDNLPIKVSQKPTFFGGCNEQITWIHCGWMI